MTEESESKANDKDFGLSFCADFIADSFSSRSTPFSLENVTIGELANSSVRYIFYQLHTPYTFGAVFSLLFLYADSSAGSIITIA